MSRFVEDAKNKKKYKIIDRIGSGGFGDVFKAIELDCVELKEEEYLYEKKNLYIKNFF